MSYAEFAGSIEAWKTLMQLSYEVDRSSLVVEREAVKWILDRCMQHVRGDFVRKPVEPSSVELLALIGDPGFDGDMCAVAELNTALARSGKREFKARRLVQGTIARILERWGIGARE